MHPPLFGIETEYAFAALGPEGQRLEGPIFGRMLSRARARVPSLRDAGGTGLFLANGSRFYIDCGHPELTTPECTHPREIVRYIAAGERLLEGLARDLEEEEDVESILFFKTNVDYGGNRSTWGCHESYLYRADPEAMRVHLLPHLVSRVIYTGAGGFHNRIHGVEFAVSPRVHHLERDSSAHSTELRGIFHTKNEPLCGGGYRRLHLLCGESECSELAIYLKVGVTALLVRLVEAGECRAEALALDSPVRAMRRFTADPSCKVAVRLADGRRMTALEIQREYRARVEARLGEPYMPEWAGEVCELWGDTLDRLETGAPGSVATRLDWALKLDVFQARARVRGVAWGSLAKWKGVHHGLARALAGSSSAARRLDSRVDLSPSGPLGPEIAKRQPYLDQRGLHWEGFPAYLALRAELQEIDVRFGAAGPRGIFRDLDGAGLLEHRLSGGRPDLDLALHEPPALGRARLRGELVRELSERGARYSCTWNAIHDLQEDKLLQLSDPFERRRPAWRARRRLPDLEVRGLRERLRRSMRRAPENEEEIPF